MNTGKEYKLERMLLKHENLLKSSSIFGHDLQTIRARQGFIRAWQELYGKDSLYILRGLRVPLLLLLQSAGSNLGGKRLLVHNAKQVKKISLSLNSLIEAIFRAEPLLYDLELCFSRLNFWNFSEDDNHLNKFRLNALDDPTDKKFYVKRSEFFVNFTSLFWQDILILVKCDRNGEKIISLDFVREAEKIPLGEKYFYLVDSGLVNREGRISFANKDKILIPDKDILDRAAKELREYFAGEREEFTLPFAPESGTQFQKKVWQNIGQIPYGATRSYLRIAEAMYSPEQAGVYTRAVGHACGSNPLPIFIPCHRVIGEQGNLIGFSGGLDIKSKLLNLELFNL